jgi:hypothetical protein
MVPPSVPNGNLMKGTGVLEMLEPRSQGRIKRNADGHEAPASGGRPFSQNPSDVSHLASEPCPVAPLARGRADVHHNQLAC